MTTDVMVKRVLCLNAEATSKPEETTPKAEKKEEENETSAFSEVLLSGAAGVLTSKFSKEEDGKFSNVLLGSAAGTAMGLIEELSEEDSKLILQSVTGGALDVLTSKFKDKESDTTTQDKTLFQKFWDWLTKTPVKTLKSGLIGMLFFKDEEEKETVAKVAKGAAAGAVNKENETIEKK